MAISLHQVNRNSQIEPKLKHFGLILGLKISVSDNRKYAPKLFEVAKRVWSNNL